MIDDLRQGVNVLYLEDSILELEVFNKNVPHDVIDSVSTNVT